MNIFITRNLAAGSPLSDWAANNGHTLSGRSFLRFAPVDFAIPEQAEWWFFYSSRAVEFGLPEGAGVPDARLAAMGEGTAATLLARAGRVDFTGRGTPREVAASFAEVAAEQRVFFPRARQSRLTVQTLIADQITVLDAICYDNQPEPPLTPVAADVMIFTSPLNVTAYLTHHDAGARPQVQDTVEEASIIAIGPSTAAALRSRGISCRVADAPTETGLLRLLEVL